jgi:thiosulfate dehydrogenase
VGWLAILAKGVKIMKNSTKYIILAAIAAAMTLGAESQLNFNPPMLSDAPKELEPLVQQGYNIIHETHKYAPNHVGNELDCTNCHFNAGMMKDTLSLVGVASEFPKYNPVVKKVVDLATMTNMCFMRYLNADPLPADSSDMLAILAYYQWISKGVPVYAEVPWLKFEPVMSEHKPNVQDGSKVFTQCMPCHGKEGQGLLPSGAPPLWGKGAFPSGPGMGKEDVLAAFVHRFMPKGNPDLSTDQALDVAAFVLSHPRPQMKKMP